MVDKEEKRKKDEELFFSAMDQLAENKKGDPENALLLHAMTAIFSNMDDLDIKIGDKND